MASTDNKENTDEVEIQIAYWPVRFRGNYLKLILEEKGVKYTSVTPMAFESTDEFFSKPIAQRQYPYFAPPILKHGQFISSQMPASCQYLAKKYKMDVESLEDSTHALMVCMNCNDIFCDLTRDNGNKMWTLDEWKEFKAKRLPKWLDLLQQLLALNPHNDLNDKKKELYYFGPSITYADTSVFWVLHSLIVFLKMDGLIKAKYEVLYRFYQQIYQRKNIGAFIKKQEAEGMAWCGGQIEKSLLAMVEQEQQ